MTIRKLLIAGGNATALVQSCPRGLRAALAAELLQDVEQVGFVDHDAVPPRLEMMGGEFCINATLAFASTLGGTGGRVQVSGLERPLDYVIEGESAAIIAPLRWSRIENHILLEGIGFVLRPLPLEFAPSSDLYKQELAGLCIRYNLPAFGAIFYSGNAIVPLVHVAAVDSFIPETACGSGSVAYSIYSGLDRIQQPTGQCITVSRTPDVAESSEGRELFTIQAQVTPLD